MGFPEWRRGYACPAPKSNCKAVLDNQASLVHVRFVVGSHCPRPNNLFRNTSCPVKELGRSDGIGAMLQSFAQRKGLKELFETGKSRHVRPDLQKRCMQILDALHHAKSLSDLALPGLRLHPNSRYKPKRWRIDVNGPWRITFEFEEGEARNIDLVQDH